ncbi:MAG TPA: VOC family protein [Candidatus Lustribacter sp.]|nr:VOC family protein [Candidatus Lustribacter sp.]
MTDTAAKATTTPIQVRKLGHLVYEVSDVERSTKFWTEIMGFTVSDLNEFGMVFLRSAGDHHSIALVPTKKKARPAQDAGLQFHHLAMEVDSVDVLFRARDFLRERGIEITYDGRRGPGGNTGVEFTDPDGYTFEIYADMDQVGPDGKVRPPEQFDRVKSLEDAVARPLPDHY